MKTTTAKLNRNLKTLNNDFSTADTFRVLGYQGMLVRLSRIGDNAKLMTLPEYLVGYVQPVTETVKHVNLPAETRYDAPHTDESGLSRCIVTASCLAGKFSGDVVIHLTPAEEKEYNRGMAMLAALG